MKSNEVLDRLPPHLRQYIKPQIYADYSAIDQAVWNYVMRKNNYFLSRYAHKSYFEGLKKTGIRVDRIPNLYGMNRILKEIGWAAVAVDGFIPPRAFMEFQAYNVLVIASEIRQVAHIEYTPAPDIIHESAGHAPLLANPEYAAFLKRFGEIGSKAISSPHNFKVFHAIRKLSIIKENPKSTVCEISQAEEKVKKLQSITIEPSEMDYLRNLHWWSVEYGLIGSLSDYKIYGAGLLSSIGESQWCLSKKVKKKPFSIEVIHENFDITSPQPHLFVTPNFAHLSQVLEEVANNMAMRTGGIKGIEKLIDSREVGTVELSTGLQISGCFVEVISSGFSFFEAAYIQTQGPTALAFRNQQIIGHSCTTHPGGFGAPLGKLKGSNLAIEDMTPSDLETYGIIEGKHVEINFESGVKVSGLIITGVRNIFGKIMLISLQQCKVTYQDRTLFQPDWGQYDMAVGKQITSVYAGPADAYHYPFEKKLLAPSVPPTAPPAINQHYKKISVWLQQGSLDQSEIDLLGLAILDAGKLDWLLVLNFYHCCKQFNQDEWESKTFEKLADLSSKHPDLRHLIKDGKKIFKQTKT